MVLKWNENLSVGIYRFDRENQIHFELLNGIGLAIASSASKEQLLRLFKRFEQYVRFHFISEENQMIETNYNRIKLHVDAHNFFLETFDTILNAFKVGETEAQVVLGKTCNFFLKHISTEDNMLGRHLTNLKVMAVEKDINNSLGQVCID